MKRSIICFILVSAMVLNVSTAMAGDCNSDLVVKRWIKERDKVEEHVVQIWAQGASPEEFASKVAVILSNEFYVGSRCRNESDFLARNLHILNKGSNLKVETVPAMILEHLVGHQILSPWNQFPSSRRKEVGENGNLGT